MEYVQRLTEEHSEEINLRESLCLLCGPTCYKNKKRRNYTPFDKC